ncbi:MAG: 1,4-alpha-glucan branching enzyme, partial [Paracoccaceae bacterium]
MHQDDLDRIVAGTHADPFSVLGLHEEDGKLTVRAFFPDVDTVEVTDQKTGRKIADLTSRGGGLFDGKATRRKKRFAYQFRLTKGVDSWVQGDPYRFGPVFGELDEHLIGEGAHLELWKVLGAHVISHEGIEGTRFAVWAPNAQRVSIVGDFNGWDGRRNGMRKR